MNATEITLLASHARPEIAQGWGAVGAHEHVARFDVGVHDAAAMQVMHGRAHARAEMRQRSGSPHHASRRGSRNCCVLGLETLWRIVWQRAVAVQIGRKSIRDELGDELNFERSDDDVMSLDDVLVVHGEERVQLLLLVLIAA